MSYHLFSEEIAMTFPSFRMSGGLHQSIFPGLLSAFLRKAFSTFIHRDQVHIFQCRSIWIFANATTVCKISDL